MKWTQAEGAWYCSVCQERGEVVLRVHKRFVVTVVPRGWEWHEGKVMCAKCAEKRRKP